MSALLPSPGSDPQEHARGSAHTFDTLATVLLLVLTTAILYFAREILVPIAIAVLLSFVLSPPVKLLRNLGLGKTIAVGIVVFSTFLVAVGLGAVLAKQISDLANDAPMYQVTATRKIEGLREFAATSPLINRLNSVIADAVRVSPPEETKKEDRSDKSHAPIETDGRPKAGPSAPIPVEIVSAPPGVLTILQAAAGVAATPLATAAFVAIFIVFLLMQREDLRNRFIRLAGTGDLHRTTVAMNDAARRLSRYFLAQVLLNTAFGVVIAIALWLIGVPSALLWGIVAIFMRFIPYIGSIGAAALPILMAALASSGWTMVVETAVLFAVTEFVTGQVIEPLVYGQNTGMSPIALVVSATFWTWLWGPVGLVLATPITVCLVVLGRHVERVAFFDVLLGDAPPLSPEQTFYQRMLAGDPSEIVDHADQYLREHTLLDYCDKVAMQALLMAQKDVRRGALEEQRQSRIRDAMRDLVDDLADQDDDATPPEEAAAKAPATLGTSQGDLGGPPSTETLPDVEVDAGWKRDKAVVCIGGRTPLDEAAAHLLGDLLGQHGIGTHVESPQSLTSGEMSHLAAADPRLVILSFLDADLSVPQARFAVRRLKRKLPGVPIAAAFWMSEENEDRIAGLCGDVRCDTCVANLPQAIKLCLERAAREPIAHAA